MSKSLRGRLLAAIFSAGVAGAFAAPACAETLADAIALAYETNPTLQAQRATQRALDENYVQARSGWRPQLSLQGSAAFTEFRSPRAARNTLIDTNGDGVPDTLIPASGNGINTVNSGSTVLNLTQPIWTGGRTAAAVSAAEGDILSGRETLRRVEAQVLLTVVQAYVDVRRDQEGVRIRQENVAVLQKQLEESKARFDVGEITRTDVAQSESRLAAAQALLQSAIAQLAVSRANYAASVGQNPGELAPVPSLAFLLPGNADDAFGIAERFSPVLRAQQFAEQASRARVAASRAERMPSLSLRGTLGFSGPVEPFDSGLYSREAQAVAVVTVPLFTGGLTTSRIRQSIERNNTDRINIETQRRAVLQTISQVWNQLVAARASIDSTAEAVRAAKIAREGTIEEQKVGLRTTLDVLNAEQELRNDELTAAAAEHDEYLAAASLLSAMGRLEAKDLIPSITQYDPKRNFRKLRFALGYVPWEEPIALVDRAVAVPPIPMSTGRPGEPPIPPGLQPPPAAASAPKK
ncbi:MAG: type secretion outer membrane protein TolC [Phenylobacterium sp.]|jgi:outer membrane protein|nr:type secretion outer membrane protein TolC [Phenylobacterium sp.]MDB5436446.1 type secretion outer membrane protein TolC [Phenylobacterium sp.]MDB5464780.1 type secretion outer membrane protein TolC [Phenylobacterium sp.]